MRIIRDIPSEGAVTFALSGSVDEDTLTDLQQSILEASHSSQNIYIDLSEVTLLDRADARWLAHRDRKIVCINCPGYLSRWISS